MAPNPFAGNHCKFTQNSQQRMGLMVTDRELSKHMVALLDLGMKYSERAGLTEERLSEAEQQLW